MHRGRRGARAVAAVIGLLLGAALLTGGSTAAATAAASAGPVPPPGSQLGVDISWPQCPWTGPPVPVSFAIIGTTHGTAFTTNPCLKTQLAWARSAGVAIQGYLLPSYPSATQLAQHGTGPWSSSTLSGRLHNFGWAQTSDALALAAAAGTPAWTPAAFWIDFEKLYRNPWPTGTPQTVAHSRWVLEGVMRRIAAARVPYGIYTNASSWTDITRGWWVPGLPVWWPVGQTSEADAVTRCGRVAPSGGRPDITQWHAPEIDYNITCPGRPLQPPMPPSVLPGDVDSDWRDDVVVRRPAGTLQLLRGSAAGAFLGGAYYPGTEWNAWTTVDTAGDLTGDGRPDLLLTQRVGPGLASLNVSVMRGTGSATPGAVTSLAKGWSARDLVAAAGDLNGDDRPDVVRRDTAGRLWFYRGKGSSDLGTARQIGSGWGGMDLVVGAGDVDGDSYGGLFAREGATGRLWLYPGTATGDLGPRRSLGTGWNAMRLLTAPGDLSGDGVPDVLAVARSTGDLWLYPGDGSGGFLARRLVSTGWNGVSGIS